MFNCSNTALTVQVQTVQLRFFVYQNRFDFYLFILKANCLENELDLVSQCHLFGL